MAVCDSELLGKKFEEGKRQLHLKEFFYKDKEVSLEEAISLIKSQAREDSTFNIVGKEAVKAATEAGMINPAQISKIQGIPFILVLL